MEMLEKVKSLEGGQLYRFQGVIWSVKSAKLTERVAMPGVQYIVGHLRYDSGAVLYTDRCVSLTGSYRRWRRR